MRATAASKALHRFIGSIAFIAAARMAYIVTEDEADRDRRLFLHVKNNLAAPAQGLGFRLEQRLVGDQKNIVASSIAWEREPVLKTADEALGEGSNGKPTVTDDCADFLSTALADGPVKLADLETEARSAGLLGAKQPISQNKPFRKARERLRVKTDRDGFGPGAKYYWSLPSAPWMPSEAMHAPQKETASMGEKGIHESD